MRAQSLIVVCLSATPGCGGGGGSRSGAHELPGIEQVWERLAQRFDLNHDGKLSVEEYSSFAESADDVRDVDRDGDGVVSGVELGTYLAGRAPRQALDLKNDPSGSKAKPGRIMPQGGNGGGNPPVPPDPRIAGPNEGWIPRLQPDARARTVPVRGDPPPNVLLISMDTVRPDRLSVYGAARDTTPNLESLAELGVVFEVAANPSNESIYSHAAIFTGLYPSEVARPVYRDYVIPEGAMMLPEILRAYGYETGGFVAGGHISEEFGINQGYDKFRAEDGFVTFWRTAPRALAWLDQRDGSKPWFVFLHGYDAHRPLVMPGPIYHLYSDGEPSKLAELMVENPMASEKVFNGRYYPGAEYEHFRHKSGIYILAPETYELLAVNDDKASVPVTDADLDHIRAHYDSALAHADLQLGMFLGEAQRHGHLDNTLIILLSDHGEDLYDHGVMNHRTELYDSCVRTPMIVVGPGFEAGTRYPGQVDALDVVPTVLAAVGAEPPAGMHGMSLADIVAGKAAHEELFFEGVMGQLAVRTATHKFIALNAQLDTPRLAELIAARELSAENFQLFDLAADPGEQDNLLRQPSASDLQLAGALRSKLVAWRETVRVNTESGVLNIPDELREELRAHGYWEMGPQAEGAGEVGAPD